MVSTPIYNPSIESLLGGNTAIVVASDAPAAHIQAANALKGIFGSLVQICDGIGDEVEINAAITACNTAGGGEVKLVGPTMYIAAGQTINKASNVKLIGDENVTLKPAGNITQFILLNGATGCTIRGINFHANSKTVTYGIYAIAESLYLHIEKCKFTNMSGTIGCCLDNMDSVRDTDWYIRDSYFSECLVGINIGPNTMVDYGKILNNTFDSCYHQGILVDYGKNMNISGNQLTAMGMTNDGAPDGSYAGIDIGNADDNAARVTVDDNHINHSHGPGIKTSGLDIIITNNHIVLNECVGVWVYGTGLGSTNRTKIDNNQILENGDHASTPAAQAGQILLDSARDVSITNNTIGIESADTDSTYLIRANSGDNKEWVTGNTFWYFGRAAGNEITVDDQTYTPNTHYWKDNRNYNDPSEFRNMISAINQIVSDGADYLLPFIELSGTTIADYSGSSNDFTASHDRTTILDSNQSSFMGRMNLFKIAGATYYYYIADAAAFTPSSGGAGNGFSFTFVIWRQGNCGILSKWDETTSSEDREYRISISSGQLVVELYDEANDKAATLTTTGGLNGYRPTVVTVVVDTSTAATPAVTVYTDDNGALAAGAISIDGGFTSMSSGGNASDVYLGPYTDTSGALANFINGYFGFAMYLNDVQLTAAQVSNIHGEILAMLGL